LKNKWIEVYNILINVKFVSIFTIGKYQFRECLEGILLPIMSFFRELLYNNDTAMGRKFSKRKIMNRYVSELSPIWLSVKISVVFFVLGCLWILLSDKLISGKMPSAEAFALLSIIKGLAYVFFTALFLFFLLLYYLKRIKDAEMKLIKSYRDLAEAHEKLESLYAKISASEEELKHQNEELVRNQKKMHHLAYHDTLTGLPNKQSLLENSQNAVFVSPDNKAALFYIDMDNFKYINDTMGHAFGDKFIVKVGERLTSLMTENCSIYRIGGDEFIVILEDIKSAEEAETFAQYIIDSFKDSLVIDGSTLSTTLSIGIALYPEHGENINDLLKFADIAMYKSKAKGKNGYVIYDNHMEAAFRERTNVEKFMRQALEINEFVLHYQPQVNVRENRIIGFEALLRWNSSELGFITPIRFIEIAEDTQFIIPLGKWVLRTSCEFLKKLHQKGYDNLTISVNISILQLLQTDFIDFVTDTLDSYRLKPEHLVLEITESMLIQSFESINMKLRQLKSLGVGIALDDFGNGYSSLSHLMQLPISTLKMDKCFISDIINNNGNKVLVGHIISLGKKLGIKVIAEGVENAEQLDFLVENQCDAIQGYIFGKPLSEEEVIKRLDAYELNPLKYEIA